MRYIQTLILALTLLLTPAVRAITVDQVPNVHVSDRNRFVSNPSGVLSASAVDSLDTALRSLWDATSVEMVVVAIDQVDPSMTPDEFATRLFEKWGIGKSDNDNGLLVLISRDDRKAVIRTGYGMEGVVPDIIAGRVIRNDMAPSFSRGDYDAGTLKAVGSLARVVSDPDYRDEVMSGQANDAHAGSDDDISGEELFMMFLWFALFVALVMLAVVIWALVTSRRLDDVNRYRELDQYRTAALFVAILTLGMGLVAYLILIATMHRVRRHKRDCPNCGHRMDLVDEEHDNDYLTPAQDTEEKIDSIDYDVWHCPNCQEVEVLPYINRETNYTVCPRCHARAMSLVNRVILRQPTVRTEGEGADIYVCRNCGNRTDRKFKIPRKTDPADAAVAGAVLGSMMGRGGGGGGGGFSGGSFGGGMTGGGGASGGW